MVAKQTHIFMRLTFLRYTERNQIKLWRIKNYDIDNIIGKIFELHKRLRFFIFVYHEN